MNKFEKYYNVTLDDDITEGMEKRYKNLDYELYSGMIDYLFDNFRITTYRKYPGFVDINTAKNIVLAEISNKKQQEKDITFYISQEAFRVVKDLIFEINTWYDNGIFWKINGILKPLQPRHYQTPIDMDQWLEMDSPKLNGQILDYVQRKSIPYYQEFKKTGNIEPLTKYYKGALESLRRIRKDRIKKGEYNRNYKNVF